MSDGLKMDAKLVEDELRGVRAILGAWMKAISESRASEKQLVDLDVHHGDELNVDQMRRELSLCAAKLEAIVASEA